MTKPLDVELSKEISSRIKSKAKKTFENASKAASLIEEAMYVQGFLVIAGAKQPIEHSWIELSDRLVDPTFPHLNKKAEHLYYFPAQRLTAKQLTAILEESREDYPEDDPLPIYGNTPYEYYGDVMLGGKDYLKAHQEAEAICRELNKRQNEFN